MIRLFTARRARDLEAAAAEGAWLRAALQHERQTTERLRGLLVEARAEAVSARDAGAAVSAEAVALYERERERAEGLEALARTAADPGIPAPQRTDQWCWVHIALRLGGLLADEHAGRAGLAAALEAAEEQVGSLLAAEYGIDDARVPEVQR
ncbi:hypothetical protein [Nocardiopsis composta]|uniref:Uncharacterized protein n=1 Tax=Nocardiopsis composta TaxID=157465 RepID=A0A7W8VH71_9ACTN|nr:hypothetical protein [Nocardiopsis composta]MBB5436302.1 hypothetical protein [Nocardiopsis composta]